MSIRQRVLVLYLSSSALDSSVIAWANYDGTGRTRPMAGDESEPPYRTGVHALRDGWRLIQASALAQHGHGDEFRTGYFKYEFFFEKLVEETSGADVTFGAATEEA
ncbi:MAG: hypothetical protein PVH91_10320 [Pseudomonadales bacterium]|jgi:hypothetical protein